MMGKKMTKNVTVCKHCATYEAMLVAILSKFILGGITPVSLLTALREKSRVEESSI